MVYHATYGFGHVLSRDGDLITVSFFDWGIITVSSYSLTV